MMRCLLGLGLALLLFATALGQLYSPKVGETVLKIEVEGRGNIYILLHTKEAPKTTAHILALAKTGFYNGQRFHRVERIPKPFLVQIGDPNSKTGPIDQAGRGGSGARIPFEDTHFKNILGAVGLARNLDDRNSGDCQFYMLLDKSSFLDGNYTLFGQVVVGLDVLKKIQKGDRVVAVTVLRAPRE
jgi:cyclophilin family peptidyl-prolyl cis-trans isomerase